MTTYQTNHTPRRRPALGLRLCFAFVFSVLSSIAAIAAETGGGTGTVSGTVLDSNTGKYLEGAEVSIQSTDLRTTTSRDGTFTFTNVPAGAQTVDVVYQGLEQTSVAVNVSAGQVASVPVKLGSDIVTLAEFRVAGTKEGMAQAVSLQKLAVNTKVVAAGDQYGDIAEGNAAEYLKFLPGVGIDYNANDARAATLRGMSTAFTNVTMNGNPIASATSGNLNRRFEFEQVAINNVETIEVYKTLTPEMQATSTGGSVNLVTKSAFDREGSLFTYRAYFQAMKDHIYLGRSEGWGQQQTHKILPGVDLNYAARLAENVGVNLSYKNSQLFNDYPRSSYSWEYNPANGGTPEHPALTSWNLQNEQKNTRRQAISAQIDWKVTDRAKLSLLADWTFYDLLFTDRTTTINTGTLAPLSTSSSVAFTPTSITGRNGMGSAQFQTINRWKSGVTWDAPLSFTYQFANGSELDASAYWSQAYSKYRDTTGSWYSDVTMQRTGLTVGFDNVGQVVPSYRLTDNVGAEVDLRDVTKFSMSQARSRPQTGVDTRTGYTADFKMKLPTELPITLKIGARTDETDRNIENHVFNRSGTSAATGFGGASAVTGAALAAMVDHGFSGHSIGYSLPAYNFLSVYKAYTQLGGLSYLPWTPGSDTVARFEDKTDAGYVRLDVTPVKDLLVVAGVRYEDRSTDAVNRLSTLPAPISATFSDQSWFPSVNLKYTPTNNLVYRFGFAKSIGLPDYSDLLPGARSITDPVNGGRGKVNIYNPSIAAYQVDNYDAGVEYYFSHSGYVSASVFRKKFKNFIVSATQALNATTAAQLGIDASVLEAPFDQYDITTKFNVPDAGYYNGIELGFAQNFTFLPAPFNTLGVQINATLLDVDPIETNMVFSSTDANLNAAILEQVNQNLQIAAVKRALNVTLNYTYGKFGFNIVTNYTGNVLKGVSQKSIVYRDPNDSTKNLPTQYFNELQYQAPRELVDVRIDYKLNRKFTPYFQVRNVFGRPIIMSTQNLPLNHAEYGDPIFELGLRGAW